MKSLIILAILALAACGDQTPTQMLNTLESTGTEGAQVAATFRLAIKKINKLDDELDVTIERNKQRNFSNAILSDKLVQFYNQKKLTAKSALAAAKAEAVIAIASARLEVEATEQQGIINNAN